MAESESEASSTYGPHKEWTERLMNNPEVRQWMQVGMFDFDLESIIRLTLRKDSSKKVDFSEGGLAACIWHLAGDDVSSDIKSWALAVIARTLAGQDGAYRLILKQRSAGRASPQKSDQLERSIRAFYIARSAEQAEARGDSSPNKVAAREHNCSLAEVKRARQQTRDLRELARSQKGWQLTN